MNTTEKIENVDPRRTTKIHIVPIIYVYVSQKKITLENF